MKSQSRVFGDFLSVSLAGLSVDRPCARAVKVDCPYPLSQVVARDGVVWALTEQRALLFREGVSSFCPEGEQWKCDIVRYRREGGRTCGTWFVPPPGFVGWAPLGAPGGLSRADVAPDGGHAEVSPAGVRAPVGGPALGAPAVSLWPAGWALGR